MEVVLCRDVYHCTPGELDRIPMSRLLRHLNALGAESEVARARMKRRSH